MYRYLLYDKKIWLNTRSHLSAILTNLKKINLKKWGQGRFRGLVGDWGRSPALCFMRPYNGIGVLVKLPI